MRYVNPLLEHVSSYQPGPTAAAIAAETGIATSELVILSSNEAPLGATPADAVALRAVAAGGELHR